MNTWLYSSLNLNALGEQFVDKPQMNISHPESQLSELLKRRSDDLSSFEKAHRNQLLSAINRFFLSETYQMSLFNPHRTRPK